MSFQRCVPKLGVNVDVLMMPCCARTLPWIDYPDATGTIARDINDRGQVTGLYYDAEGHFHLQSV
jgi:hypothetical protein